MVLGAERCTFETLFDGSGPARRCDVVRSTPTRCSCYTDLLHPSGSPLPHEPDRIVAHSLDTALFADLSDKRDELLEYLACYRARRRSSRGAGALG
jgi:hypothetical protein